MFEFIISTLISVSSGGHCPEAEEYPVLPRGSAISGYIVIDDCAIANVDLTSGEDYRMTEIVVGWRDGKFPCR